MNTMASQITSLTVVYSTIYSDADQRKHQSSASLAFVWGIHRDRGIPRTKGQLRGKCFHLMTSSCFICGTAIMRGGSPGIPGRVSTKKPYHHSTTSSYVNIFSLYSMSKKNIFSNHSSCISTGSRVNSKISSKYEARQCINVRNLKNMYCKVMNLLIEGISIRIPP